MPDFRALEMSEEVEFIARRTERGLEAVMVQGPGGGPCRGPPKLDKSRQRTRKIKCYNCQKYGHYATECTQDRQPKKCHHCRSTDHLVADCPTRPPKNERKKETTSGDTSQADHA